MQLQADVQRRLQEAERKLSEIPHFARQHKVTVAVFSRLGADRDNGSTGSSRSLCVAPQALVQALRQENADSFAEMVEKLSLAGARVDELLGDREASLGSQAEGRINRLQQEAAQLRWRSADLSRLADMKDPVCFLKVTSIRQGCNFAGGERSS